MSQWGVFHVEDMENGPMMHVAPMLPDGRLALKHCLHEFCPCGPKPEPDAPHVLVHQDPEAGGYNA